MIDGKTIAVVVPAFDEEQLIGTTLAGIPEVVDRVIVVDDASHDGTPAAAGSSGDPRVEVITHEQNQGVGAAILTGYRRALEYGVDVTCVMAGDNQMDPADLEAIAGPVARGEADYAKANRLFTGRAWELIPRNRYLGNAVLSLLTKAFFWRMREKYVIRDFHPLVFFYMFGLLFSLLGLALGVTVTILRIGGNELTVATVVLIALLLIAGLLFTLFAMLFDMESNKELR